MRNATFKKYFALNTRSFNYFYIIVNNCTYPVSVNNPDAANKFTCTFFNACG